MPSPQAKRYRAFISYCHRDREAGDRLFKRLDGYRPPKALRGRETAFGPIPAQLYPVFRDREELAASGELSSHIHAALAASDHLVVICSPNAAKSPWVNREIKAFRDLGKATRIHAALTEGEPADAFPVALIEAVSEEPVAADLRKTGDGWTNGPLKLIAGILGIEYGELKDREMARARARTRLYGAIAGLFAVLAVGAGISAWQAVEQTHRAEAELSRAEAAILAAVEGVSSIATQVIEGADRGSIPTVVADRLLATADRMVAGVIALAPDNPRLLAEQGKLLTVFSFHYRRAGNLETATSAAERARVIYDSLLARGAGTAEATYWRWAALDEQGSNLIAQGDLAGALAIYEEGLEVQRRLTESRPDDTSLAEILSISLEQIGDLRLAQGNRALARHAYEESLEIRQRLVASDPANDRWGRNLSSGLARIGDLRYTEGDRAGARRAFEERLEISRRLAALDPQNAGVKRELANALDVIGVFLQEQGDPAGALQAFEEALVILRRLVASDPGHAEWSHDLSVLLQHVGNQRSATGDRAGALQAYEESLAIARRLVASDATNTAWVRGLSSTLRRMGDVLRSQDDQAGALHAYDEALQNLARLVTMAPENPAWAADQAITLQRVGDVRLAQGNRMGALAAYQESLAISRRIAAADPDHVIWTANVAAGLNNVGDALAAAGDPAGALKAFEDALQVKDRLAAQDPDDVGKARGVCNSLFRIGTALEADGRRPQAAERYAQGIACTTRLMALDSGNAGLAEERRVLETRLSALQGL
jgi:tetratricopeptide (TPR) repeat protein